MCYTITAMIDKLRMWSAGEWKTYDINQTKHTNIFIRIYYDQLLRLSENKVLESLNVNGKIKGIYKNDVLILITCNLHQQVRKIKFQVKTNITKLYHKLSLHFPVVSYNNSSNSHHTKYKKVEKVLKTAINNRGAVSELPLTPNFNDFLKLCLLDPSFSKVVDEAQEIIKKMNL